MLSVSIAFNALSEHGTCTAVFVAVAALLVFIFASIRTLGKISWLAWVGVVCILTAGMFPFDVVRGLYSRVAFYVDLKRHN